MFNIFKKKSTPSITESDFKTRDYYQWEMWPKELVEFIANEKDSLKLAVASALVNTHSWPDWLPGKPDGEDIETMRGVTLSYTVKVFQALSDAADGITPGISQIVWMTRYFTSDPSYLKSHHTK